MPPKRYYAGIIKGFLKGDKEATQKVYTFIDAAMSSWPERLGSDADDIKADVVIKLLISLRNKELRDITKLESYIWTIAKRTCLSYRRWGRNNTGDVIEHMMLPDMALSPQQNLEKKEIIYTNYRALRLIPRECLRLFIMHDKEDLKYGEIAKRIGRAVGTIKWKFNKCRKIFDQIKNNIEKNDQPL